LTSFPLAAQATPIVSTLGNELANPIATFFVFPMMAAEFTTPGEAHSLNSVDILFAPAQGELDGPVTVDLFSDNGGSPGSPIISLGGSNMFPDDELASFMPSSPFMLSPSTTYHLVVGSSPSGVPYSIATVRGPNLTPPVNPGTGHVEFAAEVFRAFGGGWTEFPNSSPAFQINTAPEPACGSMLLWTVLLALRRKRRH
jgi:hypothetical protein